MGGKGDYEIAALAKRQHNVVDIGQLATFGVGESGIRRRVERGRLHPKHRGVFAWGRPDLTAKGRWLAAVMAVGGDAALSHRSGGALHDQQGLIRSGST